MSSVSFSLALAVALPLALGAAGGLITRSSVKTWYARQRRPAWAPPAWLFGPVWSLLYVLMGVASWLVWRAAPTDARSTALAWYAAQLLLNAAWTPVFFGARSPTGAFGVISALLVVLFTTVAAFWNVRRAAAYLMLPYLAWTAFAAALNGVVVLMN